MIFQSNISLFKITEKNQISIFKKSPRIPLEVYLKINFQIYLNVLIENW